MIVLEPHEVSGYVEGLHEWFERARHGEGFSYDESQRFSDNLQRLKAYVEILEEASEERRNRLEALTALRPVEPLTGEHLSDPKVALFPVVGRLPDGGQKNER